MVKLTTNAQLKALAKISEVVASDGYLENILEQVVAIVAELMNSNICSLMLLNDQTKFLEIKATQSFSNLYINKQPLKLGEGIAGKVALQNKPITIKDVSKEPEYKHQDIAQKEGLKSLLCVPLCVRNNVIGVINCYTSEPHSFTKSEIALLLTISNLAAISFENTNLIIKSKLIEEELAMRKKIERAKGILMKEANLSEEEAYKRLKNYSMNNRKSMEDIADIILIVDEIKHPVKGDH
ncbi:MAG: histidine kinase [Candidatus Margulisbacteria bacterium GWF2_35_9]|nr:MAG: histidine kinase [Candidatus Margulisbacteria bacterium GWF2_35_9]